MPLSAQLAQQQHDNIPAAVVLGTPISKFTRNASNALPSRPCVLNCFVCCAGSGRRVGECCEQTWALVRPTTKVLRYATKQGYMDGLELSLLGICDDKLPDAPQSNIAAERVCQQKLGEFGFGLWGVELVVGWLWLQRACNCSTVSVIAQQRQSFMTTRFAPYCIV
jgi:hypothetical protein